MDEETRSELAKVITKIVNGIPADAGGWRQMATLGNRLRNAGVDFRQYGYVKLAPFIESFDDVLELRQVESAHDDKIKVCYVRLRQPSGLDYGGKPDCVLPTSRAHEDGRVDVQARVKSGGDGKSTKLGGTEKDGVFIPERKPYAHELLIGRWAYVDPKSIKALAQIALPERWSYGEDPQPGHEYDLLRNYLNYTFVRICFEGKLLFGECIDDKTGQKRQCAAFHTGLADKKYDPIYALLLPNDGYGSGGFMQPWNLLSFATDGEGYYGKKLKNAFATLPERADYFDGDLRNAIYNIRSKDDISPDYKHIFTSRLGRLPREFLEENAPKEVSQMKDGLDYAYSLPPNDKRRADYFHELGLLISNNTSTFRRVKNRLVDAIDLAVRRMAWNYKTAIPTYYVQKNNMAMLLPLALMDDDKVDLALVVSRYESGNGYQGETVLTLDMAYKNSRLITRPDSDWLNVDSVNRASRSTGGSADMDIDTSW